MENIEIRLVKQNEYNEVENVVRQAFVGVYRPNCVEHYIVHRARENGWLVGALDYCITCDNKIIGHIMFSHANIMQENGIDQDVLVLGPVCILPQYQRKGFGTQLINHTLSLATKYGYGAVVAIANPKIFLPLGFVPAQTKNIYYKKLGKDKPAPFFLIKELQNGYLNKGGGIFCPTDVFNVSMDEVALFDKNFAPKEQIKKSNKIIIKI
ncbi:MAG: N-acetyltransferase [Clostridia bacterium]|nr:N-acetyltransferase [Clostridia bacterium]